MSGNWYTICPDRAALTATASGGPTSFTLDPDSDFAFDETCTVTITAAQVSDQDALDPPDTMAADHTFSFDTEAAPLGIHEVQGQDICLRTWVSP